MKKKTLSEKSVLQFQTSFYKQNIFPTNCIKSNYNNNKCFLNVINI